MKSKHRLISTFTIKISEDLAFAGLISDTHKESAACSDCQVWY
jgi:hypothetical protein